MAMAPGTVLITGGLVPEWHVLVELGTTDIDERRRRAARDAPERKLPSRPTSLSGPPGTMSTPARTRGSTARKTVP